MDQPVYNRRDLMRKLTMTMLGSIALPAFAAELPSAEGPVYIEKNSGKKGIIGGMDIVFKMGKEHTGGRMASTEAVLKPGFMGAPPHLHKGIDEICYVQEGLLNIWVDGKVQEVKAGDWHLRPKGLVHTFWNPGKTAVRYIDIYLPAGHEEYLKELAALFENDARPKPEDFTGLASRHDIEFHWKLLPELMKKYNVHL
ncbi:MAG: cupin domain-containing protein [Mucilaginibacter polytrichastri]|nr:cupin domain-containing protein [Mucilaginibacter polytrichastri]